MSEILLNDILRIPKNEIQNYKVKFNVYNGYEEPLMVMSRSYEEICNWIAWKKEKDDLTRQRVIAFVRYYTVSQEQWIFAGIYDVIKKSNFSEIQDGVGYNLVPISEYQNLYGRLVVSYKNTTQQLKRNAENVFNDIKIVELLKKPYNGVEFAGYNNINLTFQELEVIIKNNVDEWKRKLENVTGIYMLSDRTNGKRYIGSAYGQEGIWQRWSAYIYSQNGGNKELLQLDNDYIKKNFNFTLLEWYVIGTDIEFIISRENYWKQVMMSRKADGFGYNDN